VRTIFVGVALIISTSQLLFAQFPETVICQFEQIATAELDSNKSPVTKSDTSKGDLVITNLNSDSPVASGNIGTVKLRVLRKSKDVISLLAPVNSALLVDEYVSIITLFFKTGIVMNTKHEIIHTLDGEEKPFGFVEIGRFKRPK
jgi:hypothetical protein